MKIPKASAAKEKAAPPGDIVVNVRTDGSVVVNRRTMSGPDLSDLLQNLVKLYPEQAVVIRGDEGGAYKNVVNVLNICSEAGVTNVAFATAITMAGSGGTSASVGSDASNHAQKHASNGRPGCSL